MGLKARILKAEKRAGLGEGPPCGTCGGIILMYEIPSDGTVSYPEGDPCPECWDKPSDPSGAIRFVEILMLTDGPESEASTESEDSSSCPKRRRQ